MKAVSDSPRRFLLDQFHGLVLAATVQRAHIYRPTASEIVRNKFRIGLRFALDEYVEAYATPVEDTAHVQRIGVLADRLSLMHEAALAAGRFRVGPAQKALNLFLKYQWSAGWIPRPPHCPFDAVIIDALPYRARIRWTQLDSLEQYRALVSVARGVAAGVPLAEWELLEYEKRSPAATRARPV